MSANNVDYFEIGTPDPDATSTFYGELFGWEIGPHSDQGYRMVNTSDGGIWNTSTIGGGNWAIFYVHVDNVEETVKKAQALGANIVIPVTSNDSIDFAHLVDIHGNRFGVWHPKGT